MVTDPFHPERWDYIYNFQPGGKRRQQRRITVVFENDRLARVEGDVQAQAQPAAQDSVLEARLFAPLWGPRPRAIDPMRSPRRSG
jgi:outer membrane protein assembly factor BamE